MSVPGVLHVATTLDRGGAEKSILALARAFRSGTRRERWRVAVAYLKGEGELRTEFEALGVPVHDLDVRGVRAARAQSRLQRLLGAFAPSVVHSHLFKADVLCASALGRRRPGRPVLVSTKHNEDVYLEAALWRTLGRAAAARADAVVAVSEGVSAFLRRTLGDFRAPLGVIRYGVEPPRTAPVAPPGTGVVLCVGRLEPQKDHATLLRAAARVGAERPLRGEPIRLVLLGRGPLEETLRTEARGLRGVVVEFAGFVADPTPRIDAADVVVLASRWEGLGLALVEAALRARPAVATAVGGIPEVVDDGVTGLLVPPGDDAALAAALRRLLDDPALARRMGEAAQRRALERFSVAECAAATEALYLRCLESAT
jgi:glycosyltransferase involved in cell wall biosynthesis